MRHIVWKDLIQFVGVLPTPPTGTETRSVLAVILLAGNNSHPLRGRLNVVPHNNLNHKHNLNTPKGTETPKHLHQSVSFSDHTPTGTETLFERQPRTSISRNNSHPYGDGNTYTLCCECKRGWSHPHRGTETPSHFFASFILRNHTPTGDGNLSTIIIVAAISKQLTPPTGTETVIMLNPPFVFMKRTETSSCKYKSKLNAKQLTPLTGTETQSSGNKFFDTLETTHTPTGTA